MVNGEETEVIADNNFCIAYNCLNKVDKKRFRYMVTHTCQISETCFYDWLKYPERIKSYNDKFFIAIALNKDVKQLFTKP